MNVAGYAMKKVFSIFLMFILVASLSVSSSVEPIFAEKKSVFQEISDMVKYPFHSAAKTVGWDETPSKFSGHREPTKPLKSFIASWICQILVSDAEKMLGENSQDTNIFMSLCKG